MNNNNKKYTNLYLINNSTKYLNNKRTACLINNILPNYIQFIYLK